MSVEFYGVRNSTVAAFPAIFPSGGIARRLFFFLFLAFVSVRNGSTKRRRSAQPAPPEKTRRGVGPTRSPSRDHRNACLVLSFCKVVIFLMCIMLHVGFTCCCREACPIPPSRNISIKPRKCYDFSHLFSLLSCRQYNAVIRSKIY